VIARAPGVAQQQALGVLRDTHLAGGATFLLALATCRYQHILVRQRNRDFMEGQKGLPDALALVFHDQCFLYILIPQFVPFPADGELLSPLRVVFNLKTYRHSPFLEAARYA
jgi:hypothetical protein